MELESYDCIIYTCQLQEILEHLFLSYNFRVHLARLRLQKWLRL